MTTSVKRKRLFGMGVILTLLISMTIYGAMTQVASAANTISTSQYLDTNGDGTVDTIRWTMDENVTACAYEAGDWSVNTPGTINVTAINGISCTGGDAILNISVTASGSITGGAVNPVISYTDAGTAGSVMLALAMSGKASVPALDGAAPVIFNRITDDSDSNGKIERIDFQTTENLNDSFFAPANITVNGNVVSSVGTGDTASDNWFRVGIVENAGTCNIADQSGCTTGTTPSSQITVNASLGDALNLIATDTGLVGSTDGAAPRALGGYYADTDVNGQIDSVGIYFSENVSYTYQDSDWSATVNSLTSFDVTGCSSCTNVQPLLLVGTAAAGLTGVSGNVEPDLSFTAGNNIQDQAAAPNNSLNFTLTSMTDAALPQIKSATSSTGDGTYGPADTINVTLTFTENVAPTAANLAILLNTGATVNTGNFSDLASISSTYTVGVVGSGEDTADLSVTSVTGGILDGPNTNAAPIIPAGANIADTSAILVDTTAPTVLTVTPSLTLLTDSDVGLLAFDIEFIFDESMDVSGTYNPTIMLSPAPTGLTLNTTAWSTTSLTNDTYTFRYNLADNNESVPNIDITQGFLGVVLARDLAGNVQSAAVEVDAFSLDTQNPTVTAVTPSDFLITDADSGADNFYVDIDYSENMDGASTPVIGFTPNIEASGTLLLSASSGWQDPDTYRAYYDVADVNEQVTLTNIGIISATDTAGNTQTGYAGGGAGVVVDTLNPSVLSIAPSTTQLTDANLGGTFTVTVIYNSTMDATGANDPTIGFNLLPAGLSPNSDGWSTTNVPNDTYTYTLDLGDSDETLTGIDIDVTSGKDLSGNTQNAGSSLDAFNLDTENPTVTGITPNDLIIADNDIGPGTFWVDIDYSETMDGASAPTVTFTPDVITSGTLTYNGGASHWTDGDTFQAIYNVADVNENVTLTNVNIVGATDNNGNTQVAYDDGAGAGVQVNTIGPVITIVTPANGGNTRMATPLIVTTDVNSNCTYDLDTAGPVAMNQTGLLIHTDNLVGLAAGPHTVDISCTDIVTANVSTDSSTWTKQAPGNMVLYGVDGAGSANGVLWTINPETGAKVTNIGTLGTYYVTGLAVNPVTGRMYASTGNSDPGNDSDQSLLEIDVTTGAATYLGKNWDGVASDHHLADIGFDSTGQLYGWSEADDNMYSVDIASCNGNTCSATLIGVSGLGTYGDGLSFDSGNSLFFVGEGEDSNMYTISTATGAPVLTIPLINGSGSGNSLNAAAFDSTDMFFATRATTAGPPGPPADLVVIDTTTGIIASMGVIADINLMNAIEIYEDTLDPVITITAPTKSSTTTITNTTVQVIDPGGILAANVLATGGTLNCTQTSGIQVDCTSSIAVSGTLTVTATDDWGNAGVLAEAGYTISTGGGGGGGSAGGSGTPYVAPSTTTTDEETAEEDTSDEDTTEEPALTEATEEEMAAAEAALSDIANHWAAQYIARVFTDGYIQGYEDQTFKPDQEITRAEASKLIAMWLNGNLTDAECNGTIFSDVSCDSWYGKFVSYLHLKEIILGYEDGTFGPDQSITRAEALKIMIYAKLLQNTDISGIVNPFSDVSAEEWFHNIVMIAYKLSIVEGFEDGTFGPNKSITRAEFTKIFVETLLIN